MGSTLQFQLLQGSAYLGLKQQEHRMVTFLCKLCLKNPSILYRASSLLRHSLQSLISDRMNVQNNLQSENNKNTYAFILM